MFKKFFENSYNSYIYKNGGEFASKVNVDKDKTKGFSLLRTARLLSKYEECGGDLKFLVENDISLSLKSYNLGGSFYNPSDNHVAIDFFQGDKEATLHHEITHAKQFKALRENNFYNEDKIRLNFKNFITFNMICEADAYSSEARFVSKNKDKIGTLPNYCASFFNKSFGKNNDEKQAYNETFEWLIQDVKSPLKNYNWFLREIYLGNDKRSSIDIKEDDFIKLLDNSFEMKVDKKLIDNIVKNFKIPQDGWHKLSEESVKVGDFSFKEFPLIDFDNKEALDYMKYIVNERKDAEKIKSIIDLYKENDVVPTKEGVLYKELNKWIKSQPKEDKDALRLSNMVDTVESRISFSYNNDIAPLRTKDVEFSKTIPKNLISNNKDVLIKSKKGRSL